MDQPHPLQDLPLLRQLSADARDELRLLLEAALRRQDAEHRAAIERAIVHVPALLRTTVRSILAD